MKLSFVKGFRIYQAVGMNPDLFVFGHCRVRFKAKGRE